MEKRVELELNAKQKESFTVRVLLTKEQKESLHTQHGVHVDHIDVPVKVDDQKPIKVGQVQVECW